MAQEFHVVLCFSCQTFQVHQVKKVSRWSCKLCGEKQSLLKEFGRGSASNCRSHVQKLNSMRGAMMREQESNALALWKQMEANGDDDEEQRQNKQSQAESCWSKYLPVKEEEEEEEEEETEEQEDWLDAAQLHGKRRRREESTSGQQPHQSNLEKPSPQPACKDSSSTPSVTSASVRGSPVSRWLPFLRSSGQEEERRQACAGGLSRSPCVSEGLTGFHRAPLPQTPSIFDTGEDFDEFLPAAR